MSEKTTPKLPAKPLGGSNFPNDELIARIGRGIAATFGPPLMELVQKAGLSIEDTIRFHLVSKKCREERERAGLSIKDAARLVSVPQYRIRAVESVEIRNVAPLLLRNYLDLLGLTGWYSDWAHANAELARRLESGTSERKSSYRAGYAGDARTDPGDHAISEFSPPNRKRNLIPWPSNRRKGPNPVDPIFRSD